MRVMSASVHDMNLSTLVIFRRDLAGVGQAGFFFHRQRIHVGTHQHGWPIAILHDANHSVTFQVRLVVLAKVLGYIATQRA